jgi:coenzyme F420-0:L-glutamate ligase/coenzyme F420-1:gamma-L-glutamate ligase
LADGYAVFPVRALPEVRPGDDLAALIASRVALQDGDVVVVTSKVVSKAEGRLVTVVGDRETARLQAVDAETVRVVARRGTTTIAQTRHGLVLAAAGVDASNVRGDELALLPLDPDASARQIREQLSTTTGRTVAVVISDTLGRPWRVGQTDCAIGVAGLAPLRDARGGVDTHGHLLEVTEIAVADELAAAAELVKGKADGVPVAVVRGLGYDDDGRGARSLVRPAELDWFPLGTTEAHRTTLSLRRTVHDFSHQPVDLDVVRRAITAASDAPATQLATPCRFVLVEQRRPALLASMVTPRAGGSRRAGARREVLEAQLGRHALHAAPCAIVVCLVRPGTEECPQEATRAAKEQMLLCAVGAGIQSVLVQLATEGLGSAWLGSTLFDADLLRRGLELPPGWEPVGALAVGHAAYASPERPARDAQHLLLHR